MHAACTDCPFHGYKLGGLARSRITLPAQGKYIHYISKQLIPCMFYRYRYLVATGQEIIIALK